MLLPRIWRLQLKLKTVEQSKNRHIGVLYLIHSRKVTKRNWGRREMAPVRSRQDFRNIASSHFWSALLWKWQTISPTAVRFNFRICKRSRFISYTDYTPPISTQNKKRRLSHTFCPFWNITASILRSGRSPDFRTDLSAREYVRQYRLELKTNSKLPKSRLRKMSISNLFLDRGVRTVKRRSLQRTHRMNTPLWSFTVPKKQNSHFPSSSLQQMTRDAIDRVSTTLGHWSLHRYFRYVCTRWLTTTKLGQIVSSRQCIGWSRRSHSTRIDRGNSFYNLIIVLQRIKIHMA